MSLARHQTRITRTIRSESARYTVDASVFINAFRPQERGHAESLRFLTLIHEAGDAVIVPTLLVTEIASAVARANDDSKEATRYATAVAALPNITLVALSQAMARRAGETAANYRLRARMPSTLR